MAKLDLTGLMTGLPTDQDLRTQGQARAAQIQGRGLGSNLARGIASRAPQREEMMRQGLGGMFGVDTRTGDQQQKARMQQALSGLKLDTPEGLMQLAKIQQSTGDLAGAAQSINAARSLTAQKQGTAQATKSRDVFAAYLDKTYPDKGYGALALQGVITPANAKNFIKEASTDKKDMQLKTMVNSEGKTVLANINLQTSAVEQTWDTEQPTINSNVEFSSEKVLDAKGNTVLKMFKRAGDSVKEIATLGVTEAAAVEKNNWVQVEAINSDGASELHFYDINNTQEGNDPSKPVMIIKTNENRETVEEIDTATGQTVRFSQLPNGKGKIPFGVAKMPTFDIQRQNDGTFDVYNETLGRLEFENVATAESANQVVAQRQRTINKLTNIDRQIGFIDEVIDITQNVGPASLALLHPLMNYVPGTDAKAMQVLTESIKSEIGMEKLMELKAGSNVGASGLGALNEKELQMLQDALGRLDPTVGDKRFREQLLEVKKYYKGFRASLMGVPSEVDWTNPDYKEFTKQVTGSDGVSRTYYSLSDPTGLNSLTDENGITLWYPANVPTQDKK